MTRKKVSDELTFADEGETREGRSSGENWKIMIVDDEPNVHDVTKLALSGFRFDGHGLEFISAFSGKEARQAFSEHRGIAVVLLDVVMETDVAGLDVARFIREEAQNRATRIVLRTGQPGQAPERQVITDFDINDYKEKTELTAQKLFTLIYASLRSYRDIVTLEHNRRGLEEVINASGNIFELRNMETFTQGVLQQLTSLLHLSQDAACFEADGLAAAHEGDALRVIAGIGMFADLVGRNGVENLSPPVLRDLREAISDQRNHYHNGRFTGFFKSSLGRENLVHLSGLGTISDLDRSLIELFTNNVGVAFENIELKNDIEETQREIVYMLGEAVETRSKETGNHVKRVAEISKILAEHNGLDSDEAEIIRLASPMHDVGKIGIPDAILNKPGLHDAQERKVMQTHSLLGYDMLKNSRRRILRAGAAIARDHHEKWCGEGYPHGRKENDIHLYGRIVAVADVFDALGSDRCYKKAWSMDKIVDLFKKERAAHFDPFQVDGLMANLDKVAAIRDRYSD